MSAIYQVGIIAFLRCFFFISFYEETAVTSKYINALLLQYYVTDRGVYFAVSKIWPNNMLGKKMIEKGIKKGGEMHIFSPIGKSMHIFSPIDLKGPKMAHDIKFHLGNKY